MKPFTLSLKTVALALTLLAAAPAPAIGLISAEAASVVHVNPGGSPGARGKQLATLESYLLTQSVTVGVDPDEESTCSTNCIGRGLQIWSDSISDSPFSLARPGQKPMILVKFVNAIDSGGDVQGQVEATRMLHWGSTVSYKIEGTLLVRRTTGRRALTEDEMTEVVAHELGHLLGLDDADECAGLMGPFVAGRPRLKPSKNEVNAVVNYRLDLHAAIAKLNQK